MLVARVQPYPLCPSKEYLHLPQLRPPSPYAGEGRTKSLRESQLSSTNARLKNCLERQVDKSPHLECNATPRWLRVASDRCCLDSLK